MAEEKPHLALNQSVLLHRVWGPERVGEGSLLRNVVKKLRGKLGGAAADPRHIVTDPKVGYRMAAGDAEERNHPDSPE